MIRMFYKMMASGKTKQVKIMNQIFLLPEKVEWKVPYYSATQYVVGIDEEACLNKIRQRMQLKYDGFRVLHQEQF